MSFQAVIGQQKLKSFTKSLTCLSRYGDDIVIRATPDALFLAATNSSKSAFCRVKLTAEFFNKYEVSVTVPSESTSQALSNLEERQAITGQLLVKALLSILKHRTVDKTVDRCELSISERGQDTDQSLEADTDRESLESKLIVRLHCKHGVVKTHRLLLSSTDIYGPQLTASTQSHVTIGPRALKDILDHFPHAKGAKSDPELVWLFGVDDVKVKSMQFGGDARGKSLISTEIQMSADEFDSYEIDDPPVSLAFHLREFNATIALAEGLSVALDMQFTKPTSPIYIDFNTDSSDSEFLFVISTTQSVYDSSSPSKRPRALNLLKRERKDDEDNAEDDLGDGQITPRPTKKRPVAVDYTRKTSNPSSQLEHPVSQQGGSSDGSAPSMSRAPEESDDPVPLFMPGASQLSNADLDVLRSCGLGIEHMDYDEFEAMMSADGEEVGMSTTVGDGTNGNEAQTNQEDEEPAMPRNDDAPRSPNMEDMGMDDDNIIWPPSQVPVSKNGKVFRPLFDD